MPTFRGMLKTEITNRAQQLRLQEKVPEDKEGAVRNKGLTQTRYKTYLKPVE